MSRPSPTPAARSRRGDESHGPAAPRPRFRFRFDRAIHGPIALTLLVLVAGVMPLPSGRLRSIRQSARSMELNRAEREATAGSYYEGLIDGGPADARSELARRLLGLSPDWVRFHDIEAHYDMEGDLLQFELFAGLDKSVFGSRFTTNRYGLRDRDYPVRKPPGTFRIVLLGSSIDMGWGVGTDQTYENLLEDWLNRRAAMLGMKRRFEILNLAVAAYSPLHRVERYRRIAAGFEPDLVIYSATMLDPRLLEIHLCTLLRDRIDTSSYPFLGSEIAGAGVTPADLVLDTDEEILHKETLKKKLRPALWPIIDETVGALRAECLAEDVPLVYQIVPRVGMSDAPAARAEPVARHKAIAEKHAEWTIDLTSSFDETEQAKLEIAPWDDHPNAKGHDLLFKAMAHAIVDQPSLYRAIFGVAP